MKIWLRKLVLSATRLLLNLRYRIRVEGIERLQLDDRATLVLPNHPAYIDPAMVLAHLPLPQGAPRPVVYTETYRMPALYPLMRVVDAVEVPDLRRTRRAAVLETRELIENIADDLKKGQSFLIYPSGRLQRENHEYIGTARMAHDILSRCGQVNVVLVRIRGVWGSVFSCAPTGGLPNLRKLLLAGIPRLLGSLILFLPRRNVSLVVEQVDSQRLAELGRLELNEQLESWYNEDGGELPSYVPFHVLLKRRRKLSSATNQPSRLLRRRKGADAHEGADTHEVVAEDQKFTSTKFPQSPNSP
ncbi:MAG: 1-acyl-sn-glycerol-3-phosphate acyltransferase [Planctomycetaceae bacterium]|nr:1-acyl-sn-glycerol-3-phosphate acyltransferase [Planctomycetaceae bacterium]